MKKIGIFSLLSTLLFITNSAHSSDWEGGFTQFGIGYQNQSLSDSGGVSNGNLDPSMGAGYTASFSNKGSFTTQIGGGYNFKVSDNFLLGIGLDVSPFPNSAMNLNVTDGANSYNYSVKAKTNYDYYFDLGVVIDRNNLAYVKLGEATTNFSNGIGNVNGTLGGQGIKLLSQSDILGQCLTQGTGGFVRFVCGLTAMAATNDSPPAMCGVVAGVLRALQY